MGLEEQGFNILRETFTEVTIFNIDWIIPLILSVIVIFMITRSVSEMKKVAFPVVVMLGIMGLQNSIIVYLMSGFMYVPSIMNISQMSTLLSNTISQTASAASSVVGGAGKGLGKFTGLDQKRDAKRLVSEQKRDATLTNMKDKIRKDGTLSKEDAKRYEQMLFDKETTPMRNVGRMAKRGAESARRMPKTIKSYAQEGKNRREERENRRKINKMLIQDSLNRKARGVDNEKWVDKFLKNMSKEESLQGQSDKTKTYDRMPEWLNHVKSALTQEEIEEIYRQIGKKQ